MKSNYALKIAKALRTLSHSIEDCEVLEKAGLLHPLAIRIYEILLESKDNAIPQMEITRRLYPNLEKHGLSYYHTYTDRLVRRLEKAGIVETYGGTTRHRVGGARIKFVRLLHG